MGPAAPCPLYGAGGAWPYQPPTRGHRPRSGARRRACRAGRPICMCVCMPAPCHCCAIIKASSPRALAPKLCLLSPSPCCRVPGLEASPSRQPVRGQPWWCGLLGCCGTLLGLGVPAGIGARGPKSWCPCGDWGLSAITMSPQPPRPIPRAVLFGPGASSRSCTAPSMSPSLPHGAERCGDTTDTTRPPCPQQLPPPLSPVSPSSPRPRPGLAHGAL